MDELFDNMQYDLDQLTNWFYNNLLTINVKKAKYIIFSRTQNKETTNRHLNIKNIKIERVQHIIFLGITIQENLKWDKHINNILKKMSMFLGALKKGAFTMPPYLRQQLYNSFIYPHLIYLNCVWSHTTKSLTEKLEVKIREYTRTIHYEEYNASTTTSKTRSLQKKYNILNFNQIRTLESAICIFKIAKNTLKTDIEIPRNYNLHEYNTRKSKDINIFAFKTEIMKQGFIFNCTKIYNTIPDNIRNEIHFPAFKKQIKKYISTI
jgi:hypothetical protein